MMQPGYPPQTLYGRGGYSGYPMMRGGYPPQNPMAYGHYAAAGYPQPYAYPQYPTAMYGPPQGYPTAMYDTSRGRGGFYPSANRGGFRGGRGGVRGYRKKKPFVGGSLETQKEWEQRTACCFYRQGKCKFGESCRYLHVNDSEIQCQFGDKCRVHGSEPSEMESSGKGSPAAAPADEVKKSEAAEALAPEKDGGKPEGKKEEAAEGKEEEKRGEQREEQRE